MPTFRYAQNLRDALARTITDLAIRQQAYEAQAAAEEDQLSEGTRRISGGLAVPPAAPGEHIPAPGYLAAKLDERITRLAQIRDWLHDDEELAHIIDDVIGQQVKAAERRQARLSIILNIVFLFLGWGLSLLGTPAAVVGLFTPPHS